MIDASGFSSAGQARAGARPSDALPTWDEVRTLLQRAWATSPGPQVISGRKRRAVTTFARSQARAHADAATAAVPRPATNRLTYIAICLI
jgi:hypothetical protein